jgi:integrase
VLTQAAVQRRLAAMTGQHALMARWLSGDGRYLLESRRPCLQDVDVGPHRLWVRGGKGGQELTAFRPRTRRDAGPAQVAAVNALHHQDLEEGCEAVNIPEALARQDLKAARETGWQWRVQARVRSLDPRSGREMRHHVRESGLKAVKRAAAPAGHAKPVSGQTLRHRMATHLREHRGHSRVLQARLGHAEVKTTEMDAQVMARDLRP